MDASSFLIPSKTLQAAELEAGMQIADFGAGSGFFTSAAARQVGPTGAVWAVDIQPDLLTRIKNHTLSEGLQNVEIVRGDLEKKNGSNLAENHFDLVMATNVLYYIEDKLALAREACRVLKSGGRVLVVDWRDSFGGMGPHPGHVITIGSARDIFEKAGFAYIADIPAGEYHWGFIAQKKEDASTMSKRL